MLLFSFLHDASIEGLWEGTGTELRTLGCLKVCFGYTYNPDKNVLSLKVRVCI